MALGELWENAQRRLVLPSITVHVLNCSTAPGSDDLHSSTYSNGPDRFSFWILPGTFWRSGSSKPVQGLEGFRLRRIQLYTWVVALMMANWITHDSRRFRNSDGEQIAQSTETRKWTWEYTVDTPFAWWLKMAVEEWSIPGAQVRCNSLIVR